MTKTEMVKSFHEGFDLPVSTTEFRDTDQMLYRHRLAVDELNREGYEALVNGDPEAYLDALVDTLYFIYGTAIELNWDIDTAFNRVHRANMAKRDPVTGTVSYRSDGKVQKPDGWQPPYLGDLAK